MRSQSSIMSMRAATLLIMFSGCCALPMGANAYEFVPTQLEWASWPGYCKARYVTVPVGANSSFARDVTRGEIDRWRSALGQQNFDHVHHFCAGMALLDRARLASSEDQRKFSLDRALEECAYTYRAIDHGSAVFVEVAIGIARVAQEQGRPADAEEYLRAAIDTHPDRMQPYAALALHYRAQSQLDRAIQVLLDAEAATGGESAESQYSLGLLSLEAGDVDAAARYASKAYQLGYPLPGLRRKLEALGRWSPSKLPEAAAPGG